MPCSWAETTIEEMDLNNEAVKSENTIQGFIDGAEEMLHVEAAYARIANAAVKAIDARL